MPVACLVLIHHLQLHHRKCRYDLQTLLPQLISLVSGLDMSQNAQHLSWTAEEVDQKLQNIMRDIFDSCQQGAKRIDAADDIQGTSSLSTGGGGGVLLVAVWFS